MIAVRLPWLSERLGQPVLAVTEPPLGLERDDDVVPPDAVLFIVRCPSARLMAGVPNALPGASCFSALDVVGKAANALAWERWVDLFLSRAITEPSMREADVQALGPDRDVLAVALLRLWSWIPEHADPECPALGPDGHCHHLPNMPGEPFQDILKFLASKLRRAPSEILAMPFDAFVLNYRILRGAPKAATVADDLELSPDMIEREVEA